MNTSIQKRIIKCLDDIQTENLTAEVLVDLMDDCLDQTDDKETIHLLLDLAHFQPVAEIMSKADLVEEWLEKIIQLIENSQFHVGYLLKQRAKRYNKKAVFNLINGNELETLSYETLWIRVQNTAEALSALGKNGETPVIGLLTHNQLNGVLVDLACLSFGYRNIPIPLNATAEHLSFILDQAKITHLFIGGKTGFRLWNDVHQNHNITIIALNNSDPKHGKVLDWDTFLDKRDQSQDFNLDQKMASVSMTDVQSIMYTSGTTANPKGIIFNQINIISKRFARGLALPEIGPNDTFLCYLPLFHTFGRYFELLGSIHWGATYSFAESPAFNSLLKDFHLVNPTVFISIPKRWVQLYEMLEQDLDLDVTEDALIQTTLNEITGGKLKWGLSAAGFLDPDLFNFFQSHGINLLSGYGMTEATGGITMTPPNDYIIDSVGTALPGIKLRIAEDGELCINGSYVTEGYYDENKSDVFKDGWFHTGDIFEERDGHYFIVDRKKDIYKNSRGQTIAPQKIENLFQDFDSVKSIFLVGDGREFNTVLIFPDKENASIEFDSADDQVIRDLYSSMILSVNSFLSSFERIVNFVIINRDFSAEKGELTPKGSFKRKNILENFSDIIEPLYEKNYVALHAGAKEILIPNWLLREIGVLRSNVRWDGQKISVMGKPDSLILSWVESKIQLGDFTYSIETDILDIGSFIQSPALWLGNFAFTEFFGHVTFRLKEPESYTSIKVDESVLVSKLKPVDPFDSYENILQNLHFAIRQYLCHDTSCFKLLTDIVDGKLENWSEVVLDTYLIYQDHPIPQFRLKMIEALTPLMSGDFLVEIIRSAYTYQRGQEPEKEFSFNINRAGDEHYKAFIQYLKGIHSTVRQEDENELAFIQAALLLISDFGIIHPTRFVWARAELVWWQLSDVPKPLFSTAEKAYYALIKGFRNWIGKSSSLTIDRDSGDEYTWKDVITFDDNVKNAHKTILLDAINETSLVREAIFLLSSNSIVGLNDIPKKGIWVTHLGTRNKKSVFRLLVRTHSLGTHNLVVNLNEGLEREFLEDEIKWLTVMGSGSMDITLVENFGGYWPEYHLYTEEYIHGETLADYLERNKDDIQDETKVDRWQMRWLHFIWNGIQAYQEFWNRTEFTLSIHPASPTNLIIPKHDYTTGTKLISISGRKPTPSVAEHFLSLYTDYIAHTEENYEGLVHMSDWEVIFMSTLQALKVVPGKEILERLKDELKNRTIRKKCELLGCTIERIDKFLEDIEQFGVLTKPVVFASLRYERWLDLNPEATLQARASILQELYRDYNLDSLLEEYPETRVRFFIMTCFKETNPDLTGEFQNMIQDMRQKKLNPRNLHDRIKTIQTTIKLNDDEKFFLARMLFPHLDPADYVELITTAYGEEDKLDLVFQTEGNDGQIYRIRPPFLPKEIAQFHSLLSESALVGTFTAQHDFLFIFNARNRLVGGLYWRNTIQNRIHLEWIVIRERYQNLSLSKRMLDDFYERMRNRGIQIITVGFYLERFFFKQGFEIDSHYGGLVKKLE